MTFNPFHRRPEGVTIAASIRQDFNILWVLPQEIENRVRDIIKKRSAEKTDFEVTFLPMERWHLQLTPRRVHGQRWKLDCVRVEQIWPPA